MSTSDTRILIGRCQAHQAVTQFARVAFDGKFGIPRAEHDPALAARRGTVGAQAASAKFAAEQRAAAAADDLAAVVALVHLVARAAVKSVAPIADANFVVGLKFVTPVTVVANVSSAFIAGYLNAACAIVTMKTRSIITSAVVVVVVGIGTLLKSRTRDCEFRYNVFSFVRTRHCREIESVCVCV